MTQAEILQQTQRAIRAKNGLLNLPIPAFRFSGYHWGFSDGTQQTVTYQWIFTPKINVAGVQFLFGNWSHGNSSGGNVREQMGANAITVTAALRVGSPITFNGAASVTIQPGGTVISDPHPKGLAAGTAYIIKVCVTVATLGLKWPIGLTTNIAGEGFQNGTDETLTSTITTGSVQGYHPFAIIGKAVGAVTYGNVGVVGDSIAMGSSGDTIDYGWIRRGLEAVNVPFVRYGCGGGSMFNFGTLSSSINATSQYNILLNAVSGCDYILTNFGSNDLTLFADLPTAQAGYLAWWTQLNYLGAKVIQPTVLPRTNYTAPQVTMRSNINDWFRDGAPIVAGVAVAVGTAGALRAGQTAHPLYKVIEAADLAETARNSNVWKTNYSTDGVHPTATGATAIAAAIVASDYIL